MKQQVLLLYEIYRCIWFKRPHPFESDIIWIYIYLYGLEPGWLGVSFGLRNCYVRIIITRNKNLARPLYLFGEASWL